MEMIDEGVLMVRILIAEDETPIREMLRMSLTQAGYECYCAQDGAQAADMAEQTVFDLALLDIMLPKADGFELLAYFQPLGIPVIFLTAKSQMTDKLRGLRSGAEDYIVKPFAIAELLARIEVVFRRFNKSSSQLTYDEWKVDLPAHRLFSNTGEAKLTPKEFDLFVLLIRNRGTVLFRDYLFQAVWETDPERESRTLDLHIQRIRKKLSLGKRLRSVYGMGYRLD